MSGTPAYHGWTHRPKGKGGTDPVNFELPWVRTGPNGGHLQTESAYYVPSSDSNFATNDGDVFENDASERGILVKQSGVYWVRGVVGVGAGDAAVGRSLRLEAAVLSGYPNPGGGFGGASIVRADLALPSTTTGRKSLWWDAIWITASDFTPLDPADPLIVSLVSLNLGTNFTINGFDETNLWMFRIGGFPT